MIGMNLVIETPSRIEPCLLEQTRPAIVDLVARSLPPVAGWEHGCIRVLQPHWPMQCES
jgi:hypothetical protein